MKKLIRNLIVFVGMGLAAVPLTALAVTHTLQFVQTPTITLYSSISGTATTMRVTPYPKDLDGTKLTISDFGSSPTVTVDPKVRSTEEIIGFTGITDNGDNTATLTGLTRDLLSKYPYTTVGTGRTHNAGAVVVVSNNPQMYARFASLENDGTVTGLWAFTTSPTVPTPTTATQAASKSYVDGVAVAGASNADTATKGIVQLATQAQAASSTALGSTAAALVIAGSTATDTPGVGTSASRVVMSDLAGAVWKSVLANLSLANTFATTTTFSGAVITSETTLATSTPMTIDFARGNAQLIRKGSVSMAVSFVDQVAGGSVALTICNPSGGAGGALTFSGVLWPGGTAPTLTTTANKCDLVTIKATNATSTLVLLGGFNLNY